MCVAVMASHGHGGQIGDITGSVSLNEHEIESCFPSDRVCAELLSPMTCGLDFTLIIQKDKMIPESLLWSLYVH